jgi:hypothetical protein
MNKGIWKFLLIFGFFIAVLVFGMILIFRFHFVDRLTVLYQSLNSFVPQTQQTQEEIDVSTQDSTPQSDALGLELDRTNLQRLTQGCLSGHDCISSLDSPKFVSARQAQKILKDDDLVIGVAFDNWQKEDDYVKAYPVKILNWHEVVNDYINEIPIAVTYSPLTMAHRVFQTMDGGSVDPLGVSEMMINSGIVLYDRDTKSLWNQFDGAALTGIKRDQKMKLYPSVLVRWADWVREYPTTEVLSTNTGFDYNYNEYPYGDYAQKSDVFYPLEHTDDRLKPKDTVLGVVIGNNAKVYPLTELEKAFANSETITDEFFGKKIVLSNNKKLFKAVDSQTKEQLSFLTGYYFAWEAFYPGVEIFKAQTQPVST